MPQAFSFDVYDATQELVLQVFDQHYQHVLTGGPQGNAVEQLGSRGPHAFLGATSLDPALLMRGRGLQDAWLPLWSLDPLSDKPHTCCDVHVKMVWSPKDKANLLGAPSMPVQSTIRVPLFAARTLNPTDQYRVTLSPR